MPRRADSIIFIALATVASAVAQNCPTPPTATNVALPEGVPPALRSALGDIALPGEPFDSSDVVVKGHKYRRYIFVWKVGGKWIVATEVGGIALRRLVSVYKLSEDGKTAILINKGSEYTYDVCGSATKLVPS